MPDPSFNLIDQPWIPCLWPDGTTTIEPLRRVLARSHEIQEVQDPSPLLTVSLHRLLIALVHRTHPIRTEDDWIARWKARELNAATVDDYFDRPDIHERFDLFHSEHPFFQVPSLTVEKPAPISQLAMEQVSGNNPVLFDHRIDSDVVGVAPDEAARRLLALQFTSIGFGQSSKPMRNGKKLVTERIDFKDAPLARGATVYLYGNNLFETLLLNTLISVMRGKNTALKQEGTAVWEWETIPMAGEAANPRGYLDYLTWPSRWMRLVPELLPNGELEVRQVMICQGVQLKTPVHDPFKRYVADKKEGVNPLGLRADKALWRDSASWLEIPRSGKDSGIRPAAFEQVAGFLLEGSIERAGRSLIPFRVSGFGAKPGKAASIEFWRSEELVVPDAYLHRNDLVSELSNALDAAETAARELRMTIRGLAHLLYEHEKGAGADKNKVDDFTKNTAVERRYWPALERPFNDLLNGLPSDTDHQVHLHWHTVILKTMEHAFENAVRGLPRDARSLRAETKARGRLHGSINKLKREWNMVEQEETA